MNRRDFVRCIASTMRENNVRQPVSSPKQVFHISDDDGNTKDFVVKKTDKSVIFTADDIEAVLDAALYVIEESLKRGEPVSIRGFGSLGLKYRKPRATKKMGTGEWVEIDARYIPKFSFGNDLRLCAKIYELSLNDSNPETNFPIIDDADETDGE